MSGKGPDREGKGRVQILREKNNRRKGLIIYDDKTRKDA
jgi:hypothetical protein